MSQQEILLQELVSCRDFLMRQLEDLAREEGNDKDALGWQWLRQYQKWPSKRLTRRRPSQRVYVTAESVWYWGWSFTRSPIQRRVDTTTMLIERSINDAQKGGPTILPWVVLDNKWIVSTPVRSQEEALLAAVKAMGEALSQVAEPRRKWCDVHPLQKDYRS